MGREHDLGAVDDGVRCTLSPHEHVQLALDIPRHPERLRAGSKGHARTTTHGRRICPERGSDFRLAVLASQEFGCQCSDFAKVSGRGGDLPQALCLEASVYPEIPCRDEHEPSVVLLNLDAGSVLAERRPGLDTGQGKQWFENPFPVAWVLQAFA